VIEVDLFGPGEELAPILMSEVHCSGNETSIARCPHRTEDENIVCDHLEDAGVVCAMEPNERGWLCL
jgi:hypothetical protein